MNNKQLLNNGTNIHVLNGNYSAAKIKKKLSELPILKAEDRTKKTEKSIHYFLSGNFNINNMKKTQQDIVQREKKLKDITTKYDRFGKKGTAKYPKNHFSKPSHILSEEEVQQQYDKLRQEERNKKQELIDKQKKKRITSILQKAYNKERKQLEQFNQQTHNYLFKNTPQFKPQMTQQELKALKEYNQLLEEREKKQAKLKREMEDWMLREKKRMENEQKLKRYKNAIEKETIEKNLWRFYKYFLTDKNSSTKNQENITKEALIKSMMTNIIEINKNVKETQQNKLNFKKSLEEFIKKGYYNNIEVSDNVDNKKFNNKNKATTKLLKTIKQQLYNIINNKLQINSKANDYFNRLCIATNAINTEKIKKITLNEEDKSNAVNKAYNKIQDKLEVIEFHKNIGYYDGLLFDKIL